MVKQKLKHILVREKEFKKLKDHKIHPNQPCWEIIKEILEKNKEVK